jgi:hypothetical protein
MRCLLLVGVVACGTTTGAKIDAGPPARLTINLTGTAIGYVESDPPGIACGSTCNAMFPAGTEVTLFPTVGHDGAFGGWGDACFGSQNCTLTIDGDQTVTAMFPCTGKKVFNYVGGSQPIQMFSAPACAAHVVIEANGAQGGNLGGLGAQIQGTFDINTPPRHDLAVLVGAMGASTGGGGGSFVYANVADAVPLVAAGGGGGGCADGPGSATQTPTTVAEGTGNAPGGSGGGGGSGGIGAGGGGGAGWLSDGHPGSTGAKGAGGRAPRNGGTDGGRGGGGSSGYGGGGGFNGGGGGNNGCGGGGGSYNGGENPTNLEGVWPAGGRVTITWTE